MTTTSTDAVAVQDVADSARGLSLRLDALRHLVSELAATPLDRLDAPEAVRAHDTIRAATDQLRVLTSRLLAHVEADGRWAATGSARAFPEWVARRGPTSVGSARRDAALGRALASDLPVARAAAESGGLSFEHAQVLAQLGPTSPARRAALAGDRTDRNEAYLVTTAQRTGVDEFRRAVRRWGAAVDTATHEEEHAAAVDREYLRISRRPDGVELQGFLADEHAAMLATALKAVAGVPAADDARPVEQRNAAALTDLAALVLDGGLGGAGKALVRPHISVHVPYDTLERLAGGANGCLDRHDGTLGLAAELEDGTLIPLSVLGQIACDSDITRIVFGPDGQPLDVGRTHRTYTGAQRRAVIARDRHCQYPTCGAPPTLGEVHHIWWWWHGGPTSVANGILLCAFHHRTVHRREVDIVRVGNSWEFRERDGQRIDHHPRGPASATEEGPRATPDDGRGPGPGTIQDELLPRGDTAPAEVIPARARSA